MKNLADLEGMLNRIDGRGYKAYKEIAGHYRFKGGWLFVDYVQGDPFAAPSKLRVRLEQVTAQIPSEWFGSAVRRFALEDYLARRVQGAIHQAGTRRRGSGKSGRISVDAGRQEILERTAVRLNAEWVETRIEAGLPAAGRRVLGREAAELLCEDLPAIAREALIWSAAFEREARHWVQCAENQESIRRLLPGRKLAAFVADDSVLPRQSGVSDQPQAKDQVVRFRSPETLKLSFELPHPVDGPDGTQKNITGMGIPEGVTLIVGGGYHGKSTLLRAIERGVYPHIPGDGREYVITHPDAVKVRAEDRRRVERVDVSPFISGLPNGQSTAPFSTDEASGSTSQAATLMEAMESGAAVLLMDEDTSATNLMVRDGRMQALVNAAHEPITPLVDRIRELYDQKGISTILVMGGSGDYFEMADTVIMMREYKLYDVTREAREIAQSYPTQRRHEVPHPLAARQDRLPAVHSIDPERHSGKIKIDAGAIDELRFGEETIDLRCVEQLVDRSQTRAVGHALLRLTRLFPEGGATVPQMLDALEELVNQQGLDAFSLFKDKRSGDQPHPGNFARPRRHEMAAALNRLRTLTVQSNGKPAQ